MSLLKGLKVLDFTTLLPGPYATMMLADMGAEVVRVESPTRADLCRTTPPFDGEHSTAHSYLHRSKKSLALDLKKPDAVEAIKELVKSYDVVIEQFRPDVMKRLGLDYDTLREINPSIIYCSITGYGQTGPNKSKPGHDINYLALAGVIDYSRRKNDKPVPLGIQVADVAGGSYHAVIGILAALHERSQSGTGQHIDVSMTDAAFSLNGMSGAAYLAGGEEPEPESNMLNGGGFYDYYTTSDGRFISVGSLEPQFLKILCDSIERPDLYNLAFSKKTTDHVMFKNELTEIIFSKPLQHWVDLYGDKDACVEPVLTFKESVESDHIKLRNMVVDVPRHSSVGYQKQIAFPIKFSNFQPDYKHTGVGIGADSEDILKGIGLSIEQIKALMT